ncbi:hypothetical protein H0H87_003613 [Tephrocybe sp. NHM501043]|nr:hypothetical protein H0H87_003613 [Tephrocybe sp. NHM501043]
MPTDPADISSLIARLRTVFADIELYRRLVGCKGSDAQQLLDSFQLLLNNSDHDLAFRRSVIIAIQRLSTRSGLYPSCYNLEGVSQIGDYPVASGGFADLYKGKFKSHVVCMKVIRRYETSQVDQVLKMFSQEAMLWGQLDHPNVLTVFGLFRFQGRVSLVMPWMENGDITKYLKANPDASRLLLAEDTGKGLAYLHQNGVIHGDLKGLQANILIDNTGHARLCDFGMSSVSNEDVIAWSTQSRGASKGGSIRWQAPELFIVAKSDNEEEPDVATNSTATDVYAWGCVCIEIFTGQVPFAQYPNDITVMLHIQSGGRPSWPPNTSPARGLTEEIWSLMERCWESPSQRPSASIIVDVFAACLIKDTRSGLGVDGISAAEFRRKMNKSLKIVTTKDIDRILSPKIPDTSLAIQEDLRGQKQRSKFRLRTSNINMSEDEFLEDPKPSDFVILLMGAAGTGKSTFVNTFFGQKIAVVGHSLRTQTSRVKAYPLHDPNYPNNRIVIVDTPGFDDKNFPDSLVLKGIVDWLVRSYRCNMKIAGVIYFHNINNCRWGGTVQRNYEVFERLCGHQAARKTVLLTTMWDSVPPSYVEHREKVLKAKYWADMLQAGSIVQRAQPHADPPTVGAQEMAQYTIDTLLFRQTTVSLQIQMEIVDRKLTLQESQAGRHLALKYKEMLDDLSGTATWSSKNKDGTESIRMQELREEINRLEIPISRKVMNFLSLRA